MNVKSVSWLAALASLISLLCFVFLQLPSIYLLVPISFIVLTLLASWWNSRTTKRHEAVLIAELTDAVRSNLYDDGKGQPISIQHLIEYLKKTSSFIQQIGEGKLNGEFLPRSGDSSLNSGNLASAVLTMKNRMAEVALQEKQRHWVATGIAEFAEVVRVQDQSFGDMLDKFISKVVKYVGANQGGVFIVQRTDSDEVTLQLRACYAYDRKKFIDRAIRPGEGLVGQAYLEGETIIMTAVPSNYISITSGLGEALPRCVTIIPLIYNDEIEGVLEVASFNVLESYQVDFLKKIVEILAGSIASINTTEHTKKLLEATQEQASQLRLKEEQLQQNLEELTSTQEAVERKSREALEQNSQLNAVLDSTLDSILTVDDTGRIQTINRAGLALFGYTERGIEGKHLISLFPPNEFDWSETNRSMGRAFKLTAITDAGRKFPVELMMNRVQGQKSALITVIIRDMTERQKAEEEQRQYIEQLHAQEEELRQNMEELSASQEEINRQVVEMSKINRELDARIAALDTSTIMSESDLFGTITFANPKFVEVSQYSLDELIGQPHKIVRHPDMPSEIFKLMWSTIKAGKVFRGIVKNRKKDGNPYWVDAVISPVLDEDGKPVKYIGVRYVIEDEDQAQKLFHLQHLALMKAGIIRESAMSVPVN